MTHTPPVPAGNQSPYPLHEAPHAPKADVPSTAPPPGDPRIARTPEARTKVPTLGLIAVGAGLAALAGGLFYALRKPAPKPAPKPVRRKRKPKA